MAAAWLTVSRLLEPPRLGAFEVPPVASGSTFGSCLRQGHNGAMTGMRATNFTLAFLIVAMKRKIENYLYLFGQHLRSVELPLLCCLSR